MNWQDIGTTVLFLVLALVPISGIVSGAMALYKWLESKLPAQAQATLAAHEAQVRSIITTVVTAIEQRIPEAPNEVKKQKAMEKINQIMVDDKVPETSITWIDTMLEEIVSKLPATYDHSDETTAAVASNNASYPTNPLLPKSAKPAAVNPFLDVPQGTYTPALPTNTANIAPQAPMALSDAL
jgi:hypothetical protein